jgi:hypothetical protein
MDWDDDPHRIFIFSNADVLKKIRWRHFLADCQPFVVEFSALDELLAHEIERARTWLSVNYKDIMENYDPTVVKLQRKRKIVLSHGVLDDLDKLTLDDDPVE